MKGKLFLMNLSNTYSYIVQKHSFLFVCGISLTSGQLVSELFPDCTRSCFSQVLLRRRGGDRIYEMRCLLSLLGQSSITMNFVPVCHKYVLTLQRKQIRSPEEHESMVSLVSRRYMKVVNGSLVVCLSEYLSLRSVYILVIKVCFVKRSGIAIFDFQNNVV